jgi:hypothetical protein
MVWSRAARPRIPCSPTCIKRGGPYTAWSCLSGAGGDVVLGAERQGTECTLESAGDCPHPGHEQDVARVDDGKADAPHPPVGLAPAEQDSIVVELAAVNGEPGERMQGVVLEDHGQSSPPRDPAKLLHTGLPSFGVDVMEEADRKDGIKHVVTEWQSGCIRDVVVYARIRLPRAFDHRSRRVDSMQLPKMVEIAVRDAGAAADIKHALSRQFSYILMHQINQALRLGADIKLMFATRERDRVVDQLLILILVLVEVRVHSAILEFRTR